MFNIIRFSPVMAFFLFVGIGRADPLDTWTSIVAAPTNVVLAGVTYGGGQFVVVGDNGTVLTSSNGLSWLPQDVQTNIAFSTVAYGDGKFVAMGRGYQFVSVAATSLDGVKWTESGPAWYDFFSRSLAYGNGTFVTVGQDTGPTSIINSSQGTNWWPSGWTFDMWGLTHGNGWFVAVGLSFNSCGFAKNSGILTSLDGTDWQAHSFGPPNQLYGVTYGKGQFVAVGDAGTIVSSSDAVNWVLRPSGTLNTLNDVAYGNGVFVAVSGWGDVQSMWPETPVNGAILTSLDGVNWTQRQTGTTNALNRVAYGNGRFVAVGRHGIILVSGPIINLGLTSDPVMGTHMPILEGPSGFSYTVQSSSNLVLWQTITNFTSNQSTTLISTPLPFPTGQVFYRAYSQ
jgi:hypothetical protein